MATWKEILGGMDERLAGQKVGRIGRFVANAQLRSLVASETIFNITRFSQHLDLIGAGVGAGLILSGDGISPFFSLAMGTITGVIMETLKKFPDVKVRLLQISTTVGFSGFAVNEVVRRLGFLDYGPVHLLVEGGLIVALSELSRISRIGMERYGELQFQALTGQSLTNR